MTSCVKRKTKNINKVLRVSLLSGIGRGGKDERLKHGRIRCGRIALGDVCKHAIVFFVPPSN